MATGPARAKGGESDGRVGRALKWVGGATAVLSLVFAIVRASELVSGRVERERRVSEALRVARAQLGAGDHAAAWASASAAAEADPDDAAVRRAQEDVAMAWVRNASVVRTGDGDVVGGGPRSLSELVTPLVATLDRGALAATGARKADLLAHRGWADAVRGRDGARSADPAASYRAALAADSTNPYAHAMLGHWLLSSGGAGDEALAHFAAAARGRRERAYVRRLQLRALRNAGAAYEAEILRVANAMRLDGDTIDAGFRRGVHGTYWLRMRDPAGRAALLGALPPDAHLATYRWLFADDLRDSTREASYRLYLAVLQARAGDGAGARATARALGPSRDAWRPGERALIDSLSGTPR